MVVLLLLAMIGVPILEIVVFIELGGLIGLGPTLATVVLTAIAGTALLRHQGLSALHRVRESLGQGQFPMAEIFDGLCLLVAGALLLTPGFITDFVGFLLFIPAFRNLLRIAAGRHLMAAGRVRSWPEGSSGGPGGGPGGTVIDGDSKVVTPDGKDSGPRSDGDGAPPTPSP